MCENSVAMAWAGAAAAEQAILDSEVANEIAAEKRVEELAAAVEPDGAKLTGADVGRFVRAGNARFTIVSPKTGARFTYRVSASDDGNVFFVSVLTGSNNDSDYSFLGTIFTKDRVVTGGNAYGRQYGYVPAKAPKFVHGKKSRISPNAASAKAFAWFWAIVAAGNVPPCEVWHLGRCGRCGRALTVPESIAMGLGPECAQK